MSGLGIRFCAWAEKGGGRCGRLFGLAVVWCVSGAAAAVLVLLFAADFSGVAGHGCVSDCCSCCCCRGAAAAGDVWLLLWLLFGVLSWVQRGSGVFFLLGCCCLGF